MGVRPSMSIPPISPAEMEQMVSRAGLVLNPGQMADLVLAWRQIVQLIGLIPRERALADDLATHFRLPPPRPTRRSRGSGGTMGKTAPRQGAKAKSPGVEAKPRAVATAKRGARPKPERAKPDGAKRGGPRGTAPHRGKTRARGR